MWPLKIGFTVVSIAEQVAMGLTLLGWKPRIPVYSHHCQGLHRLEKYLNKQDCLEKSLKIKFALKST